MKCQRRTDDGFRNCCQLPLIVHGKTRETKKFTDFQTALTKNIELTKELIPYWKKEEATDYDVLLNQYEPGMTVEILDRVFDQLKDGILDIRRPLAEKGHRTTNEFPYA